MTEEVNSLKRPLHVQAVSANKFAQIACTCRGRFRAINFRTCWETKNRNELQSIARLVDFNCVLMQLIAPCNRALIGPVGPLVALLISWGECAASSSLTSSSCKVLLYWRKIHSSPSIIDGESEPSLKWERAHLWEEVPFYSVTERHFVLYC